MILQDASMGQAAMLSAVGNSYTDRYLDLGVTCGTPKPKSSGQDPHTQLVSAQANPWAQGRWCGQKKPRSSSETT